MDSGPLDVVWEDGDRLFCRMWRDPGDGARREFLAVLPRAQHPPPSTIHRLTHEYGLKDYLDAAWAVRPLELVRERGSTMMVLEATNARPLDQSLAAPMPIEAFLRLGIAASHALGRLHARGLVHKDIKPSHLLVDPASGDVRLTGFGIASRLPRERQMLEPPELIAGTLSHMAPEQTGRMNRSIDSRSDLYSLGITLYQALTGSLPFTASDPMEWVHCHIARHPAPPKARLEALPSQLSAIVMKLLAKTPDERYQTAAGLEHDLRRCLDDWERRGVIADFPLGERDHSDRLLIPEKLYGREREIETLLACFDAVVASARPRLILVCGPPGIGKSSVVSELHKVLAPSRGLYASGKFDRLKRDVPYATVAQAFQRLIRQILGKPEVELSKWRDLLRQALDPNGALVVDLIPDLKFIIGPQPAVPEVPPAAAKVRFQRALHGLIGVFARAEHPLTLFVDDLQWVDEATLDLLESLLVQPELQHVLVVGAYRDNEVDAAHPLMRKLSTIRDSGAIVEEVVVGPLTHDDLTRWFAVALHGQLERTRPLAQLVHEKTAGNPFFAQQFLHELADGDLVTFDPDSGGWRWDLEPIRSKGYTDSAVDLLVGRLSRLPLTARDALQALACLGNKAESSTMALVHGTSPEELHADLWEALRLELIVQSDESYRFVHDRVQEAAYSLIPEVQRAPAHLRIGRLLVEQVAPAERDDAVFDIVGHFNRAAALVISQDEREEVAALNLTAGKRAMKAAAFASALSYLAAGAALAATDSGRRDLAFELEIHRAECEYLTGQVQAAEERLRMLSSRAASIVERSAVTCLQADVYYALQRPDHAVLVCAECLRQAGHEIATGATAEVARAAYDRVRSRLDGVEIDKLAALPLMTDPASRAILDLVVKANAIAAVADSTFEVLILCIAAELTFDRGLYDASCHAFAHLGYLAAWRFGDFEAAFHFGRLGQELMERKGLRRFEAFVSLSLSTLVLPWAKHATSYRPMIRRSFEVAHNTGDRFWAVEACNVLLSNLLFAGDPLVDVEREADVSVAFCAAAAFADYTDAVRTQAALIRSLRGLTHHFGSLDDERFDELRMENHFASQPHIQALECWYWIRKMQARFLAGDYAVALDASRRAQELLSTSPGMVERIEHELYSGLTHAALSDTASSEGRQHVASATTHLRELERWVKHCPANFENRAALVAAELARVEGRDADATRLYEQAIRSARDNGFVNSEALALELAARFYAARGFDRIAKAYLRDAWYGYRQWGADGKVRQLETQYPYLGQDEPHVDPKRTLLTPVSHLDLATVLKVSQAVQGETDLDKLISVVMRLGLEQAGAERGLLILPRGDDYEIGAEARSSNDAVTIELRQTRVSSGDLPQSVFQYVVRTRERVVLQEATAGSDFSDDDYLRDRRARSILCLPLLKQTRLVGIMYFENSLASGAFTPARMVLLEVLASNAAISLENARLYRDLQEREARVRRLVDANIIGIFIWHADGRVLDTNDAFLQITGYSREDLVSGPIRWPSFTSPEWQDRLARGVEEVGETQVGQAREWEYLKKDGTRVSVLVGGAIFDGHPDEGVAFVLDLTEVKRAEQAVRDSEQRSHQLQLRLADANRIASVGELSASIAHEINQPLAGIIINASTCLRLLAANPPNIEIATETVRRALRDGNRASGVITRLRALFAHTETVTEPVDLNEVTREVLALASHELQRERVILRSELADGAWVVRADRVQLQQVVFNLVRNAVDAMRDVHDRPRELTVGTEQGDGNCVRLTVKDSGVGIGSQDPERLFDAFYTTKKTGMGIGLSVSRSIVESHRGRLWAASNEGPGVAFYVSLPV